MNDRLNTFWKYVVAGFTVVGVLVAMNQAFFWNPFGFSLLRNGYLYFILACFLPLVFLTLPAHKKAKQKRPSWYDVTLFLLTTVVCAYFGINAENIVNLGWDFTAPLAAQVSSLILWAVVLEALRRAAGLVVTIIALIFSIYPMFAGNIPVGFLRGIQSDFMSTAQQHAMGLDSILGLPLQAAGGILIGFLLFGVVLQKTGGATFFYDMAQSLFGRARGGSAKVSMVSSASLGMLSGSALSNVLTTGPLTIPAMKKAGFSARYAGGVEATASSGGSITPPIMGAAAFLMVSFVGVPYAQIALAAAIPAFLYFLGIFLQIDGYSAKKGLKGLPKSELPRIGAVLAVGWPYLGALVGLILLLVVQKNESQAPYWVIAFLLLVSALKKTDRLTPRRFFELLVSGGQTLAEIFGIIAGVGLIIGGLSMTGVSLSLAGELVALVGDNVLLILIAGAVTSFVLGMGMTISAVYVFLAIVMAPALTALGVNVIAAHLFVIYWASVSYITPPVALASFAAASIAKAPPMATSLSAMKLGAVKYIIPFCFALNPALVAQAPLPQVLLALVGSVIGVYILACSFEGWLIGFEKRMPIIARLVGGAAGVLVMLPGTTSTASGAGLLVVSIALCYLIKTPVVMPALSGDLTKAPSRVRS
ncbi:TRAP transporter permease [Cryobacterium sp. PH29-G1]|uniref:TRAP transporter permease n=1 Tax=Cryobacterium sp. PH29-G1 TaxID=3046211 RepID=UPI0024BB0E2D|nr:TRAP transporter permease [Cryobacterium sp. PH29-G1]MDJ0350752.1 TRAP transporter permease [Cryobacterium sp. PH29-G1]